jgi:hypothetical protein
MSRHDYSSSGAASSAATAASKRLSPPQSENVRTLRALAEKSANQADCHNCGDLQAGNERKKTLAGSKQYIRLAEFLVTKHATS